MLIKVEVLSRMNNSLRKYLSSSRHHEIPARICEKEGKQEDDESSTKRVFVRTKRSLQAEQQSSTYNKLSCVVTESGSGSDDDGERDTKICKTRWNGPRS